LIIEHTKKLTDIFKEGELSNSIEEEANITVKPTTFDFSNSKGHTQEEIKQIEEVIDEIKKREAQQDDNNDNGELNE